jgi:hypothetical protein
LGEFITLIVIIGRYVLIPAIRLILFQKCYSFTGPDTKLMQNSGKTKFKRTSIDRLMNTLVLWVSFCQDNEYSCAVDESLRG